MPRIVAAIVLVAVLAVGGGIIATTAYQAGVSSAVTTTVGTTATGTVVAPVVVPAYGYGWHPFGFIGWFFGFLFFLFFLFLVFALIRAIVWGGRGRRGWYGHPWGPGGPDGARAHWESRAHGTFDAWHREAHGATPGAGGEDRPAEPAERPDPSRLTRSPIDIAPPGIARGRIPAPRMAAMRTVLVVDDEPRIVQLARDYLEHAGFAVLTAGDGRAALETARRRRPDLVVLDLGLPGLDGLEVTRELRRDSAIPIVMLTARDDELDKLLGLELGADDYLTKPFSPRELVARVKAVLRRTERAAVPGDVIRVGDVVLDVPRMRTDVAGRAIELTPTEFGLLSTMAASPGRIFTRSQLLDAVRGVAFESYERAIDSHIKNLRRKIEPDPRQPRYVLTVYGVGYRFADERETTA